jgi:hypothetical protein
MDKTKVDKIIQYALSVAACEDDFKSRELGPIHLLKYVYIADLAYAERNGGKTYTGVKWQFYKFGPWAFEVHGRIEPACLFIDAEKRTFAYNGDEEGTRWKTSSRLRDSLENDLSITVTSAVKKAVHEYGPDTSRLLNYVYQTRPMLNAAPNELLDFSSVVLPLLPEKEPGKEAMSIKAQKRRAAELNEARTRIQQKLAEKKATASKKHFIRKPRYDEVYLAGQEWLDSLAGPQIQAVKGEVSFSPDIWKSRSRFDPEIH